MIDRNMIIERKMKIFSEKCFLFIFLSLCVCKKVSCKNKDWSYLVLAQRWPTAACLDIPYGKCSIPRDVSDWIIHGLWPTSTKGYPSFCNISWPFDFKDIKSIYVELNAKWPNIMTGSSSTTFWRHEWMKHGTCAASVKELDGIMKYFKRTLELHDSLNVYEILRKSAIVPHANKVYMMKSVEMAFHTQLNKTASVFCRHHKDFTYPLLDTVYLCINKKFELINCDGADESSCVSSYVTYPPFKNSMSCLSL